MDGVLESFNDVRECVYKDERYSVRDNGAVLRHPKLGKKPRPLDNMWTFGRRDDKTAYMLIGTHRIHIIVANAFLGARDSKIYVVDHIDTNRCNNRVENLRWFTRLENALNNPITRKRIAIQCGGDIQKFIDDPKCLRVDGPLMQDLSWMRTVTPEEARNAKENLERWAKKPLSTIGVTDLVDELPKDKDWMFRKPNAGLAEGSGISPNADAKGLRQFLVQQRHAVALGAIKSPGLPEYVHAVSPTVAVQVNWRTPSTFPCCPETMAEDILARYLEALKPGAVFCTNGLWTSKVVEAIIIDGGERLVVHTRSDGIKPEAVAVIYAKEGVVVHQSEGTFFSEDGARKVMTEIQGLEWTGEDCIDDYC